MALAAGLVLSFVAVGLFVATVGFSIGLDGDVFRAVSAVLLGLMGALLLSGALQARFAVAAGGVSDAGNRLIARVTPSGIGGQFVLGLLLGAVWSPCVGPTLGAASVLASQGRDLVGVALVMVAFGLGAAAPLLLVAMLSRQAVLRWRGRMLGAGKMGKTVLGVGGAAGGGADPDRGGPAAGDGAGDRVAGLVDGPDDAVLAVVRRGRSGGSVGSGQRGGWASAQGDDGEHGEECSAGKGGRRRAGGGRQARRSRPRAARR